MRCLLILVICLSLHSAVRAQHDGARDAVRLIANEKYQQVDSTLQKKKPFAGDAESNFVQTHVPDMELARTSN